MCVFQAQDPLTNKKKVLSLEGLKNRNLIMIVDSKEPIRLQREVQHFNYQNISYDVKNSFNKIKRFFCE